MGLPLTDFTFFTVVLTRGRCLTGLCVDLGGFLFFFNILGNKGLLMCIFSTSSTADSSVTSAVTVSKFLSSFKEPAAELGSASSWVGSRSSQ